MAARVPPSRLSAASEAELPFERVDLTRLVLDESQEHHAAPGTPIVEQWQISRDLYVVVDGQVEVTMNGDVVRLLGTGDFFGELAALDWGAGFGRTRTATVT